MDARTDTRHHDTLGSCRSQKLSKYEQLLARQELWAPAHRDFGLEISSEPFNFCIFQFVFVLVCSEINLSARGGSRVDQSVINLSALNYKHLLREQCRENSCL